jgi:hypothetical protein
MSAVLHEDGYDRAPAIRWAGLTALLLLAACGGEPRESPGAGTEGAAIADSAPVAPADTGGGAAADTSPGAPAQDSAPSQQAQSPAEPAKPARPTAPAEPTSPKPARETTSTAVGPKDTASKPESAPAAPTATPAPAASPAPAAPGNAGAEQTAAADAPLRDEYHQAPRDTVDQATYDGWKQYNLNCARCHGEDVLGTTIAPQLLMSLKPDGPINTQEAFVQVVCAGRPEKGMPSWCALGMDPAKINQMYSYVKGRSDGKIHPGRPARKPE